MFLEEYLYARLTPLVDGRVFPGVAPDGTADPYLVFSVIGASEGFTFEGLDGSESAQVQVSAWAQDHLQGLQTAKAAFDELVRGDGAGFGCGGVQRLPDANENGFYGTRWEFTLIPLE